MRTLGVVTVGRSDYGIYSPLLRKVLADPGLVLQLFVGGMHLLPKYGLTVKNIDDDGITIAERVHIALCSDTPEGIARSIGNGIAAFAEAYTRTRPDILVVLGDRFEMFAAAVAALPLKIPLAHIHGGEVTTGAFDDALRHSITKMSHLHFVSTQEYARRVEQLGEEPWRVVVSGAPSLDNITDMPLLTKAELEEQHQLSLPEPPLLVTYHPVTLEYEQTAWQMDQLLSALSEFERPLVFSLPNADTSSHTIKAKLLQYVQSHYNAFLVDNPGTQAYFSLMNIASAMVGNSSSGIIEAPSFQLPVVNIGTRQQGRIRATNVIDVGYHRDEILAGIRRALSFDFRAGLRYLKNPYGDGHASDRILKRLKQVTLDQKLIMKPFHDAAALTSKATL